VAIVRNRPPVTDAPPPSPEVLIEEARRRHRRRLFITTTILVVVLAAGVLAAVAIGGWGSRRGGSAQAASPPSQDGGGTSSQRAVVSVAGAPFIIQTGLLSTQQGWGLNGQVLYLTSDGGQSWRVITPKNMDGQADRLDQLFAIGPSDFWVPFSDMPGTRCQGGSCRYSAIDSTTNAGRTWNVGYLPGCFDCGIAVSFLSSEEGFAFGQRGASEVRSQAQVYETTDGGRSWVRTASLQLPIGGGSNGLTFSSKSVGWFVVAGNEATAPYRPIGGGHIATAALYRTTDGGHYWTRVALPAPGNSSERIVGIGAPQFFGIANGVLSVAVEDTATRRDSAVIYATSNGGRTWVGATTPPQVADSVVNVDGNLSTSIASPTVWFLIAGTRLYVTHDAGRTWSSSTPSASWSAGPFQLSSVDFVSAASGWVGVLYNSCGGLPRHAYTERCRNAIGLAATANGGRTWSLLSANDQ
jgi:photosystem II stability/assembly factor-like uncharacterized protein